MKFFQTLFTCSFLFQINLAMSQSNNLLSAVRNNDPAAIRTAIRDGADINAYDDDSDCVLINAVLYSSVECLQILLENHPNINQRNKFGHTAFLLAANDLAKMKLLLQHGANINDTAFSGNSALLIACSSYGTYENVKWLIDNGANPHAKRWSGETALMRAAQFSDSITINLLLSKGLDIDASPWGMTPVYYGVRQGNLEAVTCLVNHGANVNIADPQNHLPVSWAAASGDINMVNVLLKNTKQLNTKKPRDGITSLMWAVYNEHDNPEIVRSFLKKGADINARADNGLTALSWALKKGNTATVRLLRKSGAKE